MGQLDDYKLDMPTKEKALKVYEDAFDRAFAEGIWKEACTATGVYSHHHSLADLETIFTYFSKKSGRAAVYGMSLKMRLMTYNNMVKLDVRRRA